ncbi:hypothetical protein SAMN05216352_109235 [Alteribacillus bidgolensis]|uniref:Uncharacterized protein n=1 Tax=Alteribacillus bidgolensis TaxID=930129 RepID=A0A1G8M6L5_9BACI|nr:hypothetical protein SAMN05216352_109235 [Alteribacillus bidgolensis]
MLFNYEVGSAEVTAINNTTVEVDFEEEVDDVTALDFEIEGLDVENAAVKQTDDSVVVLTTSSQEGGEEYTVTEGDEVLGTFEGISAVVPEDIDIVTNSVQGIVGKEVTVRADIGEEEAGVPVTFNIDAAGDNEDRDVEVYTDEDGIASYSYTQYNVGEDQVTAYATGNADVRATNGKVYWGVKDRLTIEEVTEGNSLNNGAKKVYKVKGTTPAGNDLEDAYVNIAYAENVDVSPEDAVDSVDVTDSSALGNDYPYEYTTGGVNWVRVQLDEDGEATFTLTGENASVTPIVFLDGTYEGETWTGNNKLDSTELQAEAPTVSFELEHTSEITVTSEGVRDAAAINDNGFGEGGRDYTAVVTDKDGDVVPEGTPVYVQVDSGNGDVYFDGDQVGVDGEGEDNDIFELEADEDGEISFTLTGEKDAYATPTVFIDNGDEDGELDEDDLQEEGEIVYFTDAEVEDATLTVVDDEGEEVDSVQDNEVATFEYQSVDQNGKPYFDENYEATFEVEAGARDITVQYTDENGDPQTEDIAAGRTESVTALANSNGLATIDVTAEGPSKVDVEVSSSQNTLPNKDASVTFTESAFKAGVDYTTEVVSVNKVDNEITLRVHGGDLDGQEFDLDYSDANLFVDNDPKSENDFEDGLEKYDQVIYVKGSTDSFDHIDSNDQEYAPTTPDSTDTGDIEFTNSLFNADEDQTIELTDADLNTDSSTQEIVDVSVADSTGRTIEVTLTEDSDDSADFAGDITAAELATLADGEITVTYNDEENVDGNAEEVTDSAELDTTVPTLSSASLDSTTNATATLTANGGNTIEVTAEDALAGAYGNNVSYEILADGPATGLAVSYDSETLTIDLGGEDASVNEVISAINDLDEFSATLPSDSNSGDQFTAAEATTDEPFEDGRDVVSVTFSENVTGVTALDADADFNLTGDFTGTSVVNGSVVTITITEADVQVNNDTIVVTDNITDGANDATGDDTIN